MLTVPEAAQKVGRTPETVRRWIRSGRLRSHKIGTQHVIDEVDLEVITSSRAIAIPEAWGTFEDGTPQPNWEEIIRRDRDSH